MAYSVLFYFTMTTYAPGHQGVLLELLGKQSQVQNQENRSGDGKDDGIARIYCDWRFQRHSSLEEAFVRDFLPSAQQVLDSMKVEGDA